MKTAISIVLALLIGGACRRFDLPVPSPPTLLGVLLIACITAGYMAADWWLVK
jgi:XapX domain-containing protein